MPKPKNPLHLEVASRVRAAMVDARVPNAAELARLMQLEHSRAKNWQNGQSVPTISEMIRLADFFGVTLDWLVLGRADTLPENKRIRLRAIEAGLTPPDWAMANLSTGEVTTAEAKFSRAQAASASGQASRSSRSAVVRSQAKAPAKQT